MGGFWHCPQWRSLAPQLTCHHTIGSSPHRKAKGGASATRYHYIAKMILRTALIAPLAALALAFPAMADEIPLNALSNYLNALTTIQAEFTQVNADGTISTGTIFIKRPGMIRFEYAPPDQSLVLASAGTVAIFDAKSNQPPEQYPLSRTPLNLILAQNVDLERAKMVVGHKEDGTSTRIMAQDPKHPEYGTIDLVFTANPIELRQWVITDDLGNQTTVILGEMTKGAKFPLALFNIDTEIAKRGG